LFPEDFDFIPKSFILPDEYKLFRKYMERNKSSNFVLKPSRGKGGEGIFFMKKNTILSKEDMRYYEYIAQEYIPNPLLIDNKKFDFRLYLLVKGVDTMQAYLAREGMARFCTEDYNAPRFSPTSAPEKEGEQENMMGHLTNFCLNKESEKFKLSENYEQNDSGSKRLLSTMFKLLEKEGYDTDEVKEDLKDISTKVVMALQPFLVNSFHAEMGVGDEGNQN
jgi:hypothetical protein